MLVLTKGAQTSTMLASRGEFTPIFGEVELQQLPETDLNISRSHNFENNQIEETSIVKSRFRKVLSFFSNFC